MQRSKTYTLSIICPDQVGIVAALSGFIAEQRCNIIHSAQHTTHPTNGRFFMRIVFDPMACPCSEEDFHKLFAPIAERFSMEYALRSSERKKRMGIMVSKYSHCLVDLLWRWESGELEVDIPFVVSNHEDLRPLVERYGIPYYVFFVTKENQVDVEDKMLELFAGEVDFIVMARYMRILGEKFVAAYPSRIINIHHSFLPAFVGANPYQRAFDRGVKLVGATAHYATTDLDEGPIIFQDVTRVSHQDSVKDIVRKGRDIERQVLAQAVRWHNEDRVFVEKNKTIVF